MRAVYHTSNDGRTRGLRAYCAFTLVELLVVIGIIAALIGLLLPVLANVAARGRDLKCQSNLRSIIQAMHGYAAENRGSMPWGFVWNRDNGFWAPGSDNNGQFITWATLIGKYVNKASDGIGEESGANFDKVFPKTLQCPEADQLRKHVVSYAASWVVCVYPWKDTALTRPTSITQLLKETAIVWDTGIPEPMLQKPQWRIGADIDRQRFAFAGEFAPQYRFHMIKDVFAPFPPYGQNRPVLLDYLPQHPYFNREPTGTDLLPYQGNLRFRHRKNTTCNVAFSDGSVRQFTGRFKSDSSLFSSGPLDVSHDAIRRYFMIKWPTGVRPNPMFPH